MPTNLETLNTYAAPTGAIPEHHGPRRPDALPGADGGELPREWLRGLPGSRLDHDASVVVAWDSAPSGHSDIDSLFGPLTDTRTRDQQLTQEFNSHVDALPLAPVSEVPGPTAPRNTTAGPARNPAPTSQRPPQLHVSYSSPSRLGIGDGAEPGLGSRSLDSPSGITAPRMVCDRTTAHLSPLQPPSHDPFEYLWPYCPVHLARPSRSTSGGANSCETQQQEISHVIQHLVRDHGIIRSVRHDSGDKRKKYLVQCAWYGRTFDRNTPSTCIRCSRVAHWSDAELEAFDRQGHSGPSVCLRCYQVFLSRGDLRDHLRRNDLCPNLEQSLGRVNKARVLYAAFGSADHPPTWTPPSATTSGDTQAARYLSVPAHRTPRIPTRTATSTPISTPTSTPSWTTAWSAASIPTPTTRTTPATSTGIAASPSAWSQSLASTPARSSWRTVPNVARSIVPSPASFRTPSSNSNSARTGQQSQAFSSAQAPGLASPFVTRNPSSTRNGWANQLEYATPILPHQWNNHVGYHDVGQPAALAQGAIGTVNGQQNSTFPTQPWQQPQYPYPLPTPAWGATTPGHLPQDSGVYPLHWTGGATIGAVNPQHLGLSTTAQVGFPQHSLNQATTPFQTPSNYPQHGPNHATVPLHSTTNYHEPHFPLYDLALPDDEWLRQRWNVPY